MTWETPSKEMLPSSNSPLNIPASGLEHWLSSNSGLPPEGARLVGLDELDKSIVLAALRERSEVSAPILAIFADPAEAQNTIDNLQFFAGNAGRGRIHFLPSVDFDFYRGLLPNPETLCERNEALFHAAQDPARRVFVTTLTALLQKAVPPQAFLHATRVLKPSDEVDREGLIQALLDAGYQRQPTAYDPGIFSVRGGVVDVFCPLYPQPVRLEFFGDVIDEIRFFDPQSQLSLEKVESISLIPVGQSLIPHGEDYLEAAARIKDRLDSLGIPKSVREEVLEKIANGQLPSELSFLFPMLSKGSASIVDYFPKETLFVWDGYEKILAGGRETELPRLWKSLELFEKEPLPIADKGALFIDVPELTSLLNRKQSLFFESFAGKDSHQEFSFRGEPVSLQNERKETKHTPGSHPLLDSFAKRFKEWMELGLRIQIVCHTQTHIERIQGLFEPYGIASVRKEEGIPAFPAVLGTDFQGLTLWQGVITQSRIFPLLRLVILSEEEIFGHKKRVARSAAWAASDKSRLLSSFRDLKVGDYVVHRDHGIGRYLGLKTMAFLGVENDYVLLEYKDGDKLYIPVYRLNVLQKYVGGEGASAVLDKLGGDRWAKAKGKAQRAVAELAAELLNLHAKRKMLPGFAFSEPSQDFHEFEMEFPFDETPDQMKAIDDVNADLSHPHPMDRLICGDVGYGKTEVAMRAAYRAVLDGKQVGILVPTTVLAFQHFESLKERFKTTGARIEMVSRLRSGAEVKRILADLKEGKIDILIGTHRLLSSDVAFKDLGLLVIDEEHRFGVTHKERLKKLAESVHVLSMTATPIPRTLNMAMTGIKEISIITTPPPDRLSVRTFVCRSTSEVIAEAITNELARDGQVFFVHNRIETIFGVAEDLAKIVPKAKVEIVHGQMDADDLEKKMLAFYRGDAQILLTTAIIESGLDIPRANTIIIDQAHYMGLAQLYQLRGRVGRSDKRAYCYLLVPGENLLSDEAKQRLQVIQRYTDLGSGFSVASHDLEIRGRVIFWAKISRVI